jgi:pectinesterase
MKLDLFLDVAECYRELFRLLKCMGVAGLLTLPLAAQTNLYVAADGSAQFTSVQDAIMAVPMGTRANPVLIHIKPGTYKELIYIQREKRFFHLIGESATNTIITFDLYGNLTNFNGKPIGTFRTPTAVVDAEDFTAENLTFENAAGAVGQALAIRIDGDRAVFRRCRFLGWQDTILANRGRQYFEDCTIAGHVDFIFGGATSYFERCHIHCRGNGYVTAASTPEGQAYGFVFSHCDITGATPQARAVLGRPWRIYARTAYLNTAMSEVIRPQGWENWGKPEAEKNACYAEYNNTGPGAKTESRPKWIKQLTSAEAEAYTADKVLAGSDNWAGYRQP